jgi:hypothetical protein
VTDITTVATGVNYYSFVAMGVDDHSSDKTWLVAMSVDYYSSIATDINDVIMLIAIILLFKCAATHP